MRARTYTHTHIYTHTHTYLHIYIHTHTHIYTYIHIHTPADISFVQLRAMCCLCSDEISGKRQGGRNSTISSGTKTLRLRAKGPATVDDLVTKPLSNPMTSIAPLSFIHSYRAFV